MPFEWKISTFPGWHSLIQMVLLNRKFCTHICEQFSLWMCEKMEALPRKGNWFNLRPFLPSSYPFFPDCRDKEMKTPFYKLSFFLMFKGFCTTLLSIFITTSNKISLKYLIFLHIFCLNERITQWHYLASQHIWEEKSNKPSGSVLNILPVLFPMNIDLSFIDQLVIVAKLFKTAAEKITGF